MHAYLEDASGTVSAYDPPERDETWRHQIRPPGDEIITIRISQKREGARLIRGLGGAHYTIPRSVAGGTVWYYLFGTENGALNRLRGKNVQARIGRIWSRKPDDGSHHEPNVDLQAVKDSKATHELIVWPTTGHFKRTERTRFCYEVPGTLGVIEIRTIA